MCSSDLMALFCRRAGIDDSTPHTLGRCRQLFSHRPYPWHSVLVGCLIALGSIPPVHAASIASPQPATGWQDKPVVHAERFMAVTAHPLATRTAEDVLANGGTAVDAAVAAQMVLNLVEPQSSGIGRSEEHTSELQSQAYLVCRLLLEKKKT